MKCIQIEEDFEHCGYRCLVVVNRMCLRCGYIGVPDNHPDYKKSYMDVEERYFVHGGLTFSDKIEKIGAEPDDLWYFGFDCGHHCDFFAVDDAIKYGLDVDAKTASVFKGMNARYKEYGNVFKLNECSKDYVKEQCIMLAEQLKKTEENNGKK